eukprot:g2371.t1
MLRRKRGINGITRRRVLKNFFSTKTEEQWIEIWQKQQVKDESFYESAAEKRHYFFTIDLQGRLFTENTTPKNIATSLKSTKFLNFFFRQLKHNIPQSSNEDIAALYPDYPYISKCGKEYNFIKPADVPIVFTDILSQQHVPRNINTKIETKEKSNATTHDEVEGVPQQILEFGGDLHIMFNPNALRISEQTGRLYHLIEDSYQRQPPVKKDHQILASQQKMNKLTARLAPLHCGLIRSQLAVRLSSQIDENFIFTDSITGNKFAVETLPDAYHNHHGMPFD